MTKELILYYAYNGSIERHAAKNHDTISSLARRWHVDPDTLKHAMSGKPVCARTARKSRHWCWPKTRAIQTFLSAGQIEGGEQGIKHYSAVRKWITALHNGCSTR